LPTQGAWQSARRVDLVVGMTLTRTFRRATAYRQNHIAGLRLRQPHHTSLSALPGGRSGRDVAMARLSDGGPPPVGRGGEPGQQREANDEKAHRASSSARTWCWR